MKSGFIFVSFGLIAITFFAVPVYTTMSVGSTEPTTIGAVRCDACHSSEQDEFSRTETHKTLDCNSCHYISEFGPNLYSHNSTTLECIYCHTGMENQFNNDAHTDGKKMCNGCHSHVRLEIEKHTYNGTNMIVSVINGRLQINISLIGENRYFETVSASP